MIFNSGFYFDNAAGTTLSKAAYKSMVSVMKKEFRGELQNPISAHAHGRASAKILEESREIIAHQLQVKSSNILLTSGATEANSIAFLGSFFANKDNSKHAIISAIEHSSIHRLKKMYEKFGVECTVLFPNRKGLIEESELKKAIQKNTFFVSLMLVNNEVGVIQKISSLSKVIRNAEKKLNSRIVFHTDAAQASTHVSHFPHKLGVDVLTIDSVKLNGPKGVGALCVLDNVPIMAVDGKMGLWSLRPGTPSVALIAGFAAGYRDSMKKKDTYIKKIQILRDHFLKMAKHHIPDFSVHTVEGTIKDISPKKLDHLSPHIVNIYKKGINHDYLAVLLDTRGFSVSTKTACSGVEGEDSRTLSALHVVSGVSSGGVRISFSPWVNKKNITKLVKTIALLQETAKE